VFCWVPSANILAADGEKYMIKKKPYDGVIVAAHYTPKGEIDWVRAFERHGFVFSDRVQLNRENLVEQLRNGKRFKTGERVTYLGNDFRIKEDVRLVEMTGGNVILAGDVSSKQDALGNIPNL
jgi:hypothetical protein